MTTDRQRLAFALDALAAIAGKPAAQRDWCLTHAGKRQPVYDAGLRRYVAQTALERLAAPEHRERAGRVLPPRAVTAADLADEALAEALPEAAGGRS